MALGVNAARGRYVKAYCYIIQLWSRLVLVLPGGIVVGGGLEETGGGGGAILIGIVTNRLGLIYLNQNED